MSANAPYPFTDEPNVEVTFVSVPAGGWENTCELATSPDYTLVFVVDRSSEQVLLGFKKRGFGVGFYNGFGGKPVPGEGMTDCARRELEEETGLAVEFEHLLPKGSIYITRSDGRTPTSLVIHLFTCSEWKGEPIETEEMRPEWFGTRDKGGLPIPWAKMWPEASTYLPEILRRFDSRSEGRLLVRVDYSGLNESVDMTGCWVAWQT